MQPFSVVTAVVSIAMMTGCGGGSGGGMPPAPGVIDPSGASEVRVIDADTADIDGTRYRLLGIDAPETRQTCRAWGRTWDCGAAATEALASRAEGMRCEGSDTDRYGRTIGVCSSGGADLNAWLVANGWALAYRQFSQAYVSKETHARSNKRGIHRGEFVEPWRWRRGERLEGEDTFTGIASDPLDVDELADRMLRGDDRNVYGVWLDESMSGIVDDRVAFSFGASPGTNPTEIGGGVWTGALVGLDSDTRERIEGDAVIEIDDFARPDVDIALTGIQDARGSVRADLHWENLQLEQGAFHARDVDASVEGRFYGSAHREVGGIFETDQVTGAFGASR